MFLNANMLNGDIKTNRNFNKWQKNYKIKLLYYFIFLMMNEILEYGKV